MNKNLYSMRRKNLVDSTDCEVIAICGNRQVQETSSVSFPFSQDRSFYYLTGIDHPDWQLFIDVTNGEEFLIAPQTNQMRDLFDGSLAGEQAEKISGLKVLDYRAGHAKLRSRVKESKAIGTLFPNQNYISQVHMFAQPSRRQYYEMLRRQNEKGNLVDVRKQLALSRMVKDTDEIAEIEAMVKKTQDVLANVEENIDSYSNEAQIEASISKAFIDLELTHNYPPIVASSGNAATIHYTDNNADIKKNDLLLIDVGSKRQYYGSDITRTYRIGKPSQQKLDALSRIMQAQEQLISLVKPGISLRELENHAEDVIGKHLVEMGLISSNLSKHIRKYYPHAVSHYLGLDVHDVGDYNHPLAEGAVITVEPGIYSRELDLGVRIEDDVVVTASGCRVLGYNRPN